jgi:hypothetical protein
VTTGIPAGGESYRHRDRSSGVQEFRSSGVQEFFLRGILLTVAIREIDEVPSISTLDSELATLALRSL